MSIRYAILGLLHYEDMHGYRVKKHLEENFGFMWTVNYGQIYPELEKLNAEGFVTMRKESSGGAPPRKLYSITQEGREEFTRWLWSWPERNIMLRDPFLLRLTFYGFGENGRALEMIDGQIEEYNKQLETRRGNLERWRSTDPHVKLVSELGVSLNEMMIDWLKRAKKELSEPAVPVKMRPAAKTARKKKIG